MVLTQTLCRTILSHVWLVHTNISRTFGGRGLHLVDSKTVVHFGYLHDNVQPSFVGLGTSDDASGSVFCEGLNGSFTYLLVAESFLESSRSADRGGAILASHCRLDVVRSVLQGNIAREGGAVFITGDTPYLVMSRRAGLASAPAELP
jgi:hypothetical protein